MTSSSLDRRLLWLRIVTKIAYSDTGCWIWLGKKNRRGYGQISVGGRVRLAHRVAFELETGRSPSANGCHACDTPACIRIHPDHVQDWSQKRNIQDAATKNRLGRQARRGEAHHRAKLTTASVAEIRTRSLNGESYGSLASIYGVSRITVRDVVKARTWRATSATLITVSPTT